ncbi:S9 family peptidase [Sphingopyxis sp. MWB1]|uniref:S9 family peptidase n=1 Tax=Sphingopyxis sp. MWB1 TaxID=1537715 RepID=UPI00068E0A67|nr:prolyl oligopeptidase family serine peptidase [Sphingopyxis sp. MWB1]
MKSLPISAAILLTSAATIGTAAAQSLPPAPIETPASSPASQDTAALPASVYARAEAVLPQHVDELIFEMSVTPHWIGDTARFWFEKRARGGREYLLVDPATGTQTPLFDHQKLIEALSMATGEPVPRASFALEKLSIEDESERLRFQYGGKDWLYSAGQNVLTAAPVINDLAVESPDGRWSALVRDGNLFLIDKADGSEHRLTRDGTPAAPYATPVINPKLMIAKGTAQPDIKPDISWSPDSRRIATYRMKLEGARRLSLVQSSPPGAGAPRLFDYVYPLTGDQNTPLAEGLVFDVESGEQRSIALPARPILYYGGPYYEWSADSGALFEQRPSRGYKALQLYRIDAAMGAAKLLTEDRSDSYVDYYGHFWSYDDKGETIYWTGDAGGFAHLHSVDAQSGKRRQLTSGNWRARSVAGIDHESGRLLVIGSGREKGRDPYLRHLYSVPVTGGAPLLLTPEPLDHHVFVSPDGRYFVDNMSLINEPTRSVLRQASDGKIVMELGRADISAYRAAGYHLPEPFEAVAADGKTPIFGALFKPADFSPANRYPVIEDIYTGPHHVMTPKSFEAAMTARNANAMAQLGVISVMVDGRGTWGRSRAFQQPAYRNLHAVGLDDHIAGIRAAAANRPWMDISRAGIYGFSAGGYDVVRAMTERPDFYKVGVSASGNHDNRLDKAVWNEQWMGSELGEHYDANSNIHWAPKLTGKLLIAHGELDENVPPAASLRLVDALIRANKDFEFLMIPGADHYLDAVPYYQRRRWDFFVRELLGKTPPPNYQMRSFD